MTDIQEADNRIDKWLNIRQWTEEDERKRRQKDREQRKNRIIKLTDYVVNEMKKNNG